MVSAYNLHFDVLGLIFSHLSGNDLVSVALVNKAFLNGVTPRLYHSLVFTHTQAKKYPKIVSPFASLLAQPSLAVYVRVCDISAFPLYKGQPNQEFLNECIRALDICPNLMRFKLAPNVLPSFLPTLSRKEKLMELQVNGSLTTDQAEVLVSVKGLRSVRLDHASWCLMNFFPRWLSVLGSTLTYLSFIFTPELNETILEEILMSLPGLRGLHIRNCMKVDHAMVFRLISHTPLIESLAVTTWENTPTSTATFAGIPYLRQLFLDSRNNFAPDSLYILWSSIIAHTRASNASLTSLTLQASERQSLSTHMVDEITCAHAETLTSLRVVRWTFSFSALRVICEKCKRLERLSMHVPIEADSFAEFANALSLSESLQTLVDEPDPHTSHGPQATLRHDDVRTIMTRTAKLRHIVSDSRIWRGSGNVENLQITLERLKNSPLPSVMTFS